MTCDVKTVPAGATLREVAEILISHNISGAPVVDDEGRLVGIISESDLLDERKRQSAIPRMALFGLFIVPEKLLKEAYQEGQTLHVRDVMSRNVLTATEDTPLEHLADLMVRRRINRIPIVREGDLIGIVTREDVLRGLWGNQKSSGVP